MASRIILIFLGIALTHVANAQFVTPGTCPPAPTPPECPPEPDDECKSDGKCQELYPGQGLKCCKEGCDFICLSPILPLMDVKKMLKPKTPSESKIRYGKA